MAHDYKGGKRMAYPDEVYRCHTGRHGGSMAYSDTSVYGARSIVEYSNPDECYDTARHGGKRVYDESFDAGSHGGRMVYSNDHYDAGRHGGRMVYSDEGYDAGRHGGRMVYSDDAGRHGGRMVYSDEGNHDGRHGHGGRRVYSNTDNYDHNRRRQAAAYVNGSGYGAKEDVYSKSMEYARRTDGQQRYYLKEEQERMGDRRCPAVYTNNSGYGAKAVYSDEHARGAGGQQGYKKEERARTGVVCARAGGGGSGTVYSDEYGRVAGGQQGYRKSERMDEVRAIADTVYSGGRQGTQDAAHAHGREIEEGMSVMTLGASGTASSEHREQHDASYYNKMEKQHKRREKLGHFMAVVGAGFAMHENYKAKKVEPEDAEAHIIKEAMATAVAAGSADWAIHENRRKKEASNKQQHVLYGGGAQSNKVSVE